MRRGIVIVSLAVGFASPVYAAPGDPRLIQGVLEWPAKLGAEPFVVIRADDGKWYYGEVKSAKRLESGPLAAGGRVAVLGTESARPHEIIAIAIGSGDAAALAVALMPHVSAPAAAATPVAPLAVESPGAPSPSTPSPSTAKAPATETSTAPKTAAKPEPPAATAPTAASAPTTGPAAASGSASAPAANGSASTAASTPASAAPTAPTPPAVPTTPPLSTTPVPTTPTVPDKAAKSPAAVTVPGPQHTEPSVPQQPTLEKATPTGGESEPAAERPRWAELQGTVKVIAGNWIVVHSDSGQLTLVDLSTVRGGAQSVRPGAPISVYGTASEQKFQAMGILQPDNRPPAKPATVPPRR